jgi:hypothetical protein
VTHAEPWHARRVRGWWVAFAAAATVLVAGCGGPAVDSSCDVDGVSHEVEHIVSESRLEMTSLDSLACAGGWSLARATVSGEGQSPTSTTFLFKKEGTGLVLKAPEIACGNDPGMEVVAEELKADACSGTATS